MQKEVKKDLKVKRFQVRLNENEVELIAKIAKQKKLSKSDLFRSWLRNEVASHESD